VTGSDIAIEVSGLRNAFGAQVVHDQLDLRVRRGEIVGVVGGSGAGKSVLMRAILALRKPQAGSVRVFGVDALADDPIARARIERHTGVLFQGGALFSSLTVLENIAVPMKEHLDLPPELMHQLCFMKMRLAGLPADAAHKLPSQLSGGMKKRAGLARALALDPEIVFFDEPSAGLDPVTSRKLDELIVQIRDNFGTTIVVVSHELASIFALADRVIMLDRAEQGIIAEGNPHDLAQNSPDPRVVEFLLRRNGRRPA
jgi:phospholipid/cholesterol/gamma-HCH transport system ATP-binding protein